MTPDLSPGVVAVLTDCDALLATAIRAVEIGAHPGPEWRKQAKEMRAWLTMILTDERARRRAKVSP